MPAPPEDDAAADAEIVPLLLCVDMLGPEPALGDVVDEVQLANGHEAVAEVLRVERYCDGTVYSR